MAEGQGQQLSNGLRGRIGPQEVYVKHYHRRSPLRRVLAVLGDCDARREMRFAKLLLDNGIPTPQPLACATARRGRFCSAAVEGAQSGDAWHAAAISGGAAGQKLARQAAVALAQMVGKMHAAGLVHRDLHCGNLLVRVHDGRVQLTLMDLHRMAAAAGFRSGRWRPTSRTSSTTVWTSPRAPTG